MMGHWGGFGGWGMGFGIIFMVLLWVLVVVGIAAMIRWLMLNSGGQGGRPPQPRDRTPLEIVQERYARGEIDREEYEQKRQDLEK